MSLDITYGICVGSDPQYLSQTLDSIYSQYTSMNEPKGNFEILLAANPDQWITTKKNWIASKAKYDTLVILHDYYQLHPGWLVGLNAFDEETPQWKVCTNQILTLEGKRHTDWMMNPWHMAKAINQRPELARILMAANPKENGPEFINALPYDCEDFTHLQYISGGYIICRKHILRDRPFNETFLPGSAEDIDWSERVFFNSDNAPHFNRYSMAQTLKPGKWAVTQIPEEGLQIMREVDFD